jgi:hypothetical protein
VFGKFGVGLKDALATFDDLADGMNARQVLEDTLDFQVDRPCDLTFAVEATVDAPRGHDLIGKSFERAGDRRPSGPRLAEICPQSADAMGAASEHPGLPLRRSTAVHREA